MLSNTSREWLYADMGILGAGGVSNGIYPTDASGQVEYLCSDSGTVVLFVEDDEQLDKVLEVRARLPRLRHIIVFDFTGSCVRARRQLRAVWRNSVLPLLPNSG